MIEVAVLIPTYNREKLLMLCLESILRQTYGWLKIFIWDDGSTDGTKDSVVALKDKRITYVSGKHRGVAYARNALLHLAKDYEYACWQDSDDMSNIYRIEKQLKTIHRETRLCVSTCHTRIAGKRPKECFTMPKIVKKDRGSSLGSMMFRPSEAVPFTEGVNWGGEDVDWRRDMERSGVSIINLPYRLYYVRLTNRDRIGILKLQHRSKRKQSNELRRHRHKTGNIPVLNVQE